MTHQPLTGRPGSPRPRRRGLGRLLVLPAVVALPLLELWLLIQLGRLIGAWPVVLLVLLGIVLGVVLTRREGARAWRSLQTSVRAGRAISDEIAHGALVLLGGLALIVPGLITDVVGIFLLLPPTRRLAVRGLHRWTRSRMRKAGVDVDVLRARMDPTNTVAGQVVPEQPSSTPDADPRVIRGEVEP